MADVVERLEAWINEQAPKILAMYRFDTEDDLRRAGEAFDILRVRLPADAALRARLSQAGAGGVVVKPLEWGHIRATAVCSERYDAVGADMTYSVYLRDGGNIQWGKNHTTPVFDVASLDEAKAAAQADYEARIFAALAPSPSAGGSR